MNTDKNDMMGGGMHGVSQLSQQPAPHTQAYDVDSILAMDMATIRKTKSYEELQAMAKVLGAEIDQSIKIRRQRRQAEITLKEQNARISLFGITLPWSRAPQNADNQN